MSEPIAEWIIDERLNAQVIRLNKIFSTFNKNFLQGASGALTRASQSAQAEVNRQVPRHYELSPSKFRGNVKFSPNGIRSSSDMIIASFRYSGHVIPLIDYNTNADHSGAEAAVLKGNGQTKLDHAFGANLFGRNAVFERKTSKPFPVRQIFGPAGSSLVKNPKVTEAFEEKALQTFMTRMTHELTRILSM